MSYNFIVSDKYIRNRKNQIFSHSIKYLNVLLLNKFVFGSEDKKIGIFFIFLLLFIKLFLRKKLFFFKKNLLSISNCIFFCQKLLLY